MNSLVRMLMGSCMLSAAIAWGEGGPTVDSYLFAQSGAGGMTRNGQSWGRDGMFWPAARYEAEAEHHEAEACRAEQQALVLDSRTDSRGERRNQLLAEARSH